MPAINTRDVRDAFPGELQRAIGDREEGKLMKRVRKGDQTIQVEKKSVEKPAAHPAATKASLVWML